MNDPTPAGPTRLLRADEERLRMVAAALSRGGKLAIVVADESLWPAARECLQSRLHGHRFTEIAAKSADDVSNALRSPLLDENHGTLVLSLQPGADEAIDALNWRREDLRGATANVLVVLPGAVGHHRFLIQAPDAYSYRDVIAVLEGEKLVDEIPPFDDTAVQHLLQRARAAESSRARAHLLAAAADELSHLTQPSAIQSVVLEATDAFEHLPHLDPEDRSTLARLYIRQSGGTNRVRSYRFALKARDVILPVASDYPDLYRLLQATQRDAISTDPQELRTAISDARAVNGGPDVSMLLATLAAGLVMRGNITEARHTLDEAEHLPSMEEWSKGGRALWIMPQIRFLISMESGRWHEAESTLLPMIQPPNTVASEFGSDSLFRSHAELLLRQGELHAAVRASQAIPAGIHREIIRAGAEAEAGNLKAISSVWKTANAAGDTFGNRLMAMRALLGVIEGGLSARLIPRTEHEALDASLKTLRGEIEGAGEVDPPWLIIDCLILRADALLRRQKEEAAVIATASQACRLARSGAPLLLAHAVRRFVVAALRLHGAEANLASLLNEALAAATEGEDLGNIARLRGLKLWDATLKNSGAAEAETAMNQAIEATGSVLLEAGICRQIGTALRRTDLLERARRIYRALPWPANEGACLEALGSLDLARNRYRSYGLVLREKILDQTGGQQLVLAETD